MKNERRNPIGYRTVTRMEEEQHLDEITEATEATEWTEESQDPQGNPNPWEPREAPEAHSPQEQAAQDHFETGGWQDEAQETINDKKRMDDLLDKEQEFTNKKGLSRIRKQLILLWSYLKAVIAGEYTDYSAWAFVKATAGLLYVVSPLDLIPDFFPWVGWLDDVLVIGYVCNLLVEELDAFAAWQKQRQAVTEG